MNNINGITSIRQSRVCTTIEIDSIRNPKYMPARRTISNSLIQMKEKAQGC